jgi:hypothetical protein
MPKEMKRNSQQQNFLKVLQRRIQQLDRQQVIAHYMTSFHQGQLRIGLL